MRIGRSALLMTAGCQKDVEERSLLNGADAPVVLASELVGV